MSASLSASLRDLVCQQPAEELYQTVSLSTLHSLLTSHPDASDLCLKRPINASQPALILDLGDSLRWICGPRTDWLSGCDWRGLRLNLSLRLRDLQASLFVPVPLLPGDGGANDSQRDLLAWAAEQRQRKQRVAAVIRHLLNLQTNSSPGQPQSSPKPAFSLWLAPLGLVTALRFCLRRLETPCHQSLDGRLADCVRIAASLNCRAVASDSPLCWLLQPPGRTVLQLSSLGSAGGRSFHGYQQLQMRQALLPRLRSLLNLPPERLPMLACLLDNRFLPGDCLQRLHLALVPESDSQAHQARTRAVSLAVAKVVAGFSAAESVDEAVKLLEPHAANPEERSLLRSQVVACLDYYRPCCFSNNAQQQQPPPATDSSNNSTGAVGRKFDPWLLNRVRELHLSGRLHPWVAQVLHRQMVRLELGFEDPPLPEAAELDDRIELTTDMYDVIRARVYVLLYDIRDSKDDLGCARPAVREIDCRLDKGLRDSGVYMTVDRFGKDLAQLELPACADLWRRVGQAGDGVRTTAFLACMHGWRLADPLCAQPLLDPDIVPPSLLLPLCVLRFLLLPPPRKPVLQPYELQALLATVLAGADVDSPEAPDLDASAVAAASAAEAMEPPPTLRGLQLANLFSAGLDTAVFVSDACGRVGPEFEGVVAAGFLSFDGRRLQRMLRLADRGRATPLVLCEGCLTRLEIFERAWDALVRSLSPVGGPSFLKPRLCDAPRSPASQLVASSCAGGVSAFQGGECDGGKGGRGRGVGRGLRQFELNNWVPQPPPYRQHQQQMHFYPPRELLVAGVPVANWGGSRLSAPPDHRMPPAPAAKIASVPMQPRPKFLPSGAEGNADSWRSGDVGAKKQQRKMWRPVGNLQQQQHSSFRPLRLSDFSSSRKSATGPPQPPAEPQMQQLQRSRLDELLARIPGPPSDIEEKFVRSIGRGVASAL